jgi:hypothetical protein
MSTSSLGEKALTLSALLAALGVVGWVKWTWLKRWWHAVNYPAEAGSVAGSRPGPVAAQ